MKPILVLYGTREGQTRRIAEHLCATARGRGISADAWNAMELPPGFALKPFGGVVVAASVHVGRHEPEVVQFVKTHVSELERMPAAFLSVSLSEAGAEDPHATPESRAKSAADVERMIQEFLKETGWHPGHIRAVAGALAYTQYNIVKRFVLKMIARKAGASTDTSLDHEFTDWAALDHVIDELMPLS